MTEVVAKCEVGLDLHTGSDRRSNLPQIRADLDDALTRELAEAFAAPVMLHAGIRDGSLRHAARERGAKVLLYEAGESLALRPLRHRRGCHRRTPRAGRARDDGPGRRADAHPVRGVAHERLGAGAAHGHPRPRRARSASTSPTATGSARSSTPSARRCASSTPTAPASSSGAPSRSLVNSGDALVHIAEVLDGRLVSHVGQSPRRSRHHRGPRVGSSQQRSGATRIRARSIAGGCQLRVDVRRAA